MSDFGTNPTFKNVDVNGDLNVDGDLTLTDITLTGNLTVSGTVDGRDVATDGTKLDGIEASADVTDTANVTAAGALMDSEVDADIKTLSLPASTTISSYGKTLVDDADAAAARTTLGLGTAATTASTAYATATQGTKADNALPKAGGTMTGDIEFGDNDKAIFGAGDDLQIYHNGSHSYLDEVGTGNLFVRANNLRLSNADNSQYYLIADNSGFVKLNYAGATKLATTTSGIDISGTATMDGLTVDGGANSELRIDTDAAGYLQVGQFTNGAFIGTSSTNATYGKLRLGAGTKRFVDVGTNGDISFYEDTGSTAKFFWDASAESLGIGTVSPEGTLQVENSSNNALILNAPANRYNSVGFQTAGTDKWWLGRADSDQIASDAFFIGTDAGNATDPGGLNAKLVIDSSGNVGINTSSIDSLFTIDKDVSTAYSATDDNAQRTSTNTLLLKNEDGTTNSFAQIAFDLAGSNQSIARIVGINDGTSSSALAFVTEGSNTKREVMRLDSSGHAIIPAGVTLGTSAGVYAAANTLDDYEYGSWTPTYAGDTTAGSYTYGENQGHYVKVGNQVTCWFNLTNIAGTSGDGTARISGLPFTANWVSGFNGANVGSVSLAEFTGLDGDQITAAVTDGANYILFYHQSGTNNSTDPVDVDDKASDAADVRGFVTYYVGG